jgi:hypothetical protein
MGATIRNGINVPKQKCHRPLESREAPNSRLRQSVLIWQRAHFRFTASMDEGMSRLASSPWPVLVEYEQSIKHLVQVREDGRDFGLAKLEGWRLPSKLTKRPIQSQRVRAAVAG